MTNVRRTGVGLGLLVMLLFGVGTPTASSAQVHDAAWHRLYPLQCHMATDRTASPMP
jgi:hypothetical protein